MSTEPESSASLRLEAAVAEYLISEERGEGCDRAALLAKYADVAAELNEFFTDHDQLQGLVNRCAAPDQRFAATLAAQGPICAASETTWPSSVAPPDSTLWRIGPYEIIHELGRGGMGVVYRARHCELDRCVALKTILAGRMASAEDRARFRAEAHAAAKLSHRGIVPIFEVGEADGAPYFSMPLIEGPSLAERLHRGPLPAQTAARMMRQIVEAVAYAHAHGVIHRDLKPGNILLAAPEIGDQRVEAGGQSPEVGDRRSEVRNQKSGNEAARPVQVRSPLAGLLAADLRSPTSDSVPMIMDFGLAKRLDADELTASGQILGTPAYMPPEQAAGRRHEVGPTADIYALGAILYAMLTGQPPFVSENPVEVLLQVIEREPPLPRSLAPQVPQELEWICLKCLEKRPEHRYPTALELAADFDRFLRREPPLARLPSAIHRVRRWIRRKPVLTAHVIGLATPLAISQVIFAAHQDRDIAYHVRLCGVLLLWMAASVVCQWLLERKRSSPWPLYVWAAADASLLTAVLSLMVSPLGVFVGGYLLLVAVSALAGRTKLVAFTTAASMLGYAALLVLRPAEAQPLHYAIFAQMTLALCGLAVGYQVWRMQVLREYYGDRL